MNESVKCVFIDLDNTLIRTDLLFESVLILLKRNPLNLFRILQWLFKGRAYTKARIAERVRIRPESLPFEDELLEYIGRLREEGKVIILATASHQSYARAVADHLGIFDDVLGTDEIRNLKGSKKLELIETYAAGRDFAYAGDSLADRPIWAAATSGIFVNAPLQDVRAAEADGKAVFVIRSKKPILWAFLQGMRPHQYAKNVLVFIPLFTSHNYTDPALVASAMLAFVCFSLCASGVYFLNDLLDLDADRRHPRKCRRPLASGNLSIPAGVFGALALPLLAFGLAGVYLPAVFVLVLLGYFLLTTAYSFWLKRIATADVMTLAVLYTARIVAGAAAISVELTFWLLAFSMFVFVSLAYLKRYIELAAIVGDDQKAHGRGYAGSDSETMFSLGTANITAAVMVLALYINSDEVARLYQSPVVLWLLCLLVLYWGNRIWIGARRGKINDDPVVFALKDPVSRLIGLLFVVVVILARHLEL